MYQTMLCKQLVYQTMFSKQLVYQTLVYAWALYSGKQRTTR